MPVKIKCAKCGREMWVAPSTAKRVKHCSKCRAAGLRKTYTCSNQLFKKYFNQEKGLIYFKANEVSKGDREIFEELYSHYMIALYKNVSRIKNLRDFKKSWHSSIKYETVQYFKDISKIDFNIINENEIINLSYNSSLESDYDNKIKLNKVIEFIIEHNYKCLLLSSLGYSHSEISTISGRTICGVSNCIGRQRQMVKKYFNQERTKEF